MQFPTTVPPSAYVQYVESVTTIAGSLANPSSDIEHHVKVVNNTHQQLRTAYLKEGLLDDWSQETALTYNGLHKILNIWNQTYPQFKIESPSNEKVGDLKPLLFSFSQKTATQRALERYFELLDSRSQVLKREGDLNNWQKGTYEIIYDRKGIEEVRIARYQTLYDKLVKSGSSVADAHYKADSWSRIGVIAEDGFWTWIRQAVISPHGLKHTYNTMYWNTQIDGNIGAGVLPIIKSAGKTTIVALLQFRHATGKWEIELLRGAAKKINGKMETPQETAIREAAEEGGLKLKDIRELGGVAPDAGILASVVPLYLAEVSAEGETKHDKTEAIASRHQFTLLEIESAIKKGSIELDTRHGKITAYVRDALLISAIQMGREFL